jgi:hypothetical protein
MIPTRPDTIIMPFLTFDFDSNNRILLIITPAKSRILNIFSIFPEKKSGKKENDNMAKRNKGYL